MSHSAISIAETGRLWRKLSQKGLDLDGTLAGNLLPDAFDPRANCRCPAGPSKAFTDPLDTLIGEDTHHDPLFVPPGSPKGYRSDAFDLDRYPRSPISQHNWTCRPQLLFGKLGFGTASSSKGVAVYEFAGWSCKPILLHDTLSRMRYLTRDAVPGAATLRIDG